MENQAVDCRTYQDLAGKTGHLDYSIFLDLNEAQKGRHDRGTGKERDGKTRRNVEVRIVNQDMHSTCSHNGNQQTRESTSTKSDAEVLNERRV